MIERSVRPEWQRPFLTEWCDEGMRLLLERGIDEEDYHKKVLKPRILHFVALAHWNALHRHADSSELANSKKGDEDIQQTIGRLLGTHRTTSLRWMNGESLPGTEHIFGTLTILLRQDMHEVEFPGKYDVVWEAVRQTLPLIRKEDLKQDFDGTTLSREAHACLWLFVRHPRSKVFMKSGRDSAAIKADVLRDIVLEVRQRFPGGQVRYVEDANDVIKKWLNSYLFLRVGLLEDWEVHDDDAA